MLLTLVSLVLIWNLVFNEEFLGWYRETILPYVTDEMIVGLALIIAAFLYGVMWLGDMLINGSTKLFEELYSEKGDDAHDDAA